MKYPLLALSLLCASPYAFADFDYETENWKLELGIYAIYDFQEYEGDIFEAADIEPGETEYLRRVKGSAEIDFLENWSFELALDYKDQENETQVDDFNFSYDFNSNFSVTFGKFKEPMGLENQLSLRYQPLHERSLATGTMLFGRNSGVAFDIEHDLYTVDLAVTYQEAPSREYRDSLAHIARVTFAPVQKKKKFLHFGLNFSDRMGTEEEYDIDEPVIAASVGNLIHSPNFAAREIKLTGAEFAIRYKPLLFFGENYTQRIKQVGLADQSMHAYHATLVYTLFGNSRTYEHGKLKFRDSKDHTLEIAWREAVAKLTPVFRGNDADVTTVALSYFYKDTLRVSVEYEDATLTDNGRRNSEELSGDSFNLRLQLNY